MRLRNPDLIHLIDNSSVFSDISLSANDYLQNFFSLTLGANQEYYIGYYKPFKNLYAEINVADTSGATIAYEYWDGSAYVPLPNVIDSSEGFTKSDFISWQFEDDGRIGDSWKSNAVNGIQMYWIRITSDIDLVGSSLKGLNLVFNNLSDMELEFPRITEFLDVGQTSFINFQVAARDEIVNRLRVGGEATNVNSTGFLNGKINGVSLRQIQKWDFLDIQEIRQAAKFLTLAKIFFYVSENNEDKAFTRYQNNVSMFGDAFKMFFMSIDRDDDGEVDPSENLDLNDVRIEIV